MCSHLNVSYPHVSLHIITNHKVSQEAVGGDLGLLDDVGAEGDLADVLFVFDHSSDGRLRVGLGTKTGSVFLFLLAQEQNPEASRVTMTYEWI